MFMQLTSNVPVSMLIVTIYRYVFWFTIYVQTTENVAQNNALVIYRRHTGPLLYSRPLSKQCIAVSNNLAFTATGNSHAMWDHTVLPATRQRRESRRYPQPKQVLDLATPKVCKAEWTHVTWKQTGWKLNLRPVNRRPKSNALPQHYHATNKWYDRLLICHTCSNR